MNVFGYKFIGFAAPCNDVMLSIISLFMEIFFLGALIMFIISFLLLFIYDCFGYKNIRTKFYTVGVRLHALNILVGFSFRSFLISRNTSVCAFLASIFDSYWFATFNEYSYDYHPSFWDYRQFTWEGAIMYTQDQYHILDRISNMFNDIIYYRYSTYSSRDFYNMPIYFTSEQESVLDSFFLIMPTVIILFILIPTLGFLYNTDLDIELISPAFSIDIIGHQWYWTYEYTLGLLGKEIVFDSFYSSLGNSALQGAAHRVTWLVDSSSNNSFDVDRHLIIPTNTNILLTITSTDVIHSWAIPKLGIKVDAVPGKLANTILFTYVEGIFFGQCSELCGVFHGFMPICVEALPSELFFSWCMITYYSEHSFYYKPILMA